MGSFRQVSTFSVGHVRIYTPCTYNKFASVCVFVYVIITTCMEFCDERDVQEFHTNSCPPLSPGGSMSNMYGMVVARYHKYPQVKRTGIFGLKPLVAFTSDQVSSHTWLNFRFIITPPLHLWHICVNKVWEARWRHSCFTVSQNQYSF